MSVPGTTIAGHMMFGDPSQFAIEAELEPGPDYGPVQGKNLAGRIRVWIGNREVGRFDEPACWLGPPLLHLLRMRNIVDQLWDPSLENLSMDALFDRLDYLCFSSHRGKLLTENWGKVEWEEMERESEGFSQFPFLLNSSEAFDGWKAFLVRPTTTHLIALVAPHPQHEVYSHPFPVADFEAAVDAFSVWLRAEEQRLIPELRPESD